MTLQSVNPYTGIVNAGFEEYSSGEIHRRLELAARAFRDWKRTPWEIRKGRMLNAGKILKENARDLAGVITREMGKRISESESEILKCAWLCEYYSERAEEFLKNEDLPVQDAKAYISYEPLGPILAIMPWNFPFWQVFRFAVPSLMAGNTCLLKHASNVPQCSLAIEKIFLDAGFPTGAFQSLLISSGQAAELPARGEVKAVTLTGSEEAGKSIAEAAGRNLKKLVLELGGSDPFIILRDADIPRAAATAAKARMINCGQSCISAKRFIVHESGMQQFLDVFLQELSLLRPGDPSDPLTGYGPLARQDLVDILDRQVIASVAGGAQILLGGNRPHGFNETFYEPTVLGNVLPGMPVFEEEVFGPVAAVISASDEEEAIQLANRSRFGLGASVWSQNSDKAAAVAAQLETGMVFINEMVVSHPALPFGGIKSSGYGRELSQVGIREFMNMKAVWVNK